MNQKSLSIVLKQFKQDSISEEEAISLINDLCSYSWVPYIPTYPWYSDTSPKITYSYDTK